MSILVLRIVLPDPARESVKTRESAMSMSAMAEDPNQTIDVTTVLLRSAYVEKKIKLIATAMPPANAASKKIPKTIDINRWDDNV